MAPKRRKAKPVLCLSNLPTLTLSVTMTKIMVRRRRMMKTRSWFVSLQGKKKNVIRGWRWSDVDMMERVLSKRILIH